uniref:TLC domain-containing protein 2-like n=1 Tax=Phallusia mammillata TaxID=59560 RepID=A0A6F9DV21_9ASCI|nr:TLC domain-containing protein 2-like [Phallusia mammillata]
MKRDRQVDRLAWRWRQRFWDKMLFTHWITALSAACFIAYSYLLEKRWTVSSLVVERKTLTKWNNIIVSFTHSILSSLGCLYCFYKDPALTSDIINKFSYTSYVMASFSLGYFIHDFIHALRYQKISTAWEILLHHTVVILCFGLAVTTHKFVGYVIVALLCEINSIFLHGRMIMKLSGISTESTLYRINSLINIGTYVLFRICTLTWMTRWLILNYKDIPQPANTFGVLGMASITIINIVLFARLLFKDCQFVESKTVDSLKSTKNM